MRIAAFPAYKRKENPYQILLYNAITSVSNITVEEFNWKNAVYHTYNIVHIHWPESNKLRKNIFIAIVYIITFNILLLITKLKGAKIVWTVHNFQSHEKKFPVLESLHFRLFTKMVDGLIIMNKATIEQVLLKYAALKNKPFKKISHGHYIDWYENKISASDARQVFKFSETDRVFLVLGQIRPYKGLEILIEKFRQTNNPSYKLVIAGKTNEEMPFYKKKLEKLIDNNKAIIFNPAFVTDDALQDYFNAADVVVLPYTNLLNSGVLLLALSFNKTVAMPYFENVSELLQKYNEWIFTYSSLDNSVFEQALNKSEHNKGKVIDMADEDWLQIALETIQFYKSLSN